MRAWRWGRGGRGRIVAWREVLLVGLSSGQGWSEPRRGGFVGIWGERMGEEYVRGRNMFGVAGRGVDLFPALDGLFLVLDRKNVVCQQWADFF